MTERARDESRLDPDTGPERRCILSGAHGERVALIRLVRAPDGQILPDLGAKLPGRGAWLAPDRAAILKALHNGKLKGACARAFRTGEIAVEPSLIDLLDTGLERRALDRLGLERKAGNLLFGAEKIADAIAAGKVHALLHAGDAADDGVRWLDNALARIDPGSYCMSLPISRAQLSLALGRENVVHIAAIDSEAAERLTRDAARWRSYWGDAAPGHWAGGDTKVM